MEGMWYQAYRNMYFGYGAYGEKDMKWNLFWNLNLYSLVGCKLPPSNFALLATARVHGKKNEFPIFYPNYIYLSAVGYKHWDQIWPEFISIFKNSTNKNSKKKKKP